MTTASPEERLAFDICEALSESRMSIEGGYPDDYNIYIIDGQPHVVRATLTYDGRPSLVVQTIDNLVSDHLEHLIEMDSESALVERLMEYATRRGLKA